MLSAINPDLGGAGPVASPSEEISTSVIESQARDGSVVAFDADGYPQLFQVSDIGAVDADQLEDLRGLFGADAFSKLLLKFGTDLRRRLDILKAEPNRADVAANAHAMISSAGSLGFTAFSDLCRAVERVAQGEHEMRPSLIAFVAGADHVLRTIATITGSDET